VQPVVHAASDCDLGPVRQRFYAQPAVDVMIVLRASSTGSDDRQRQENLLRALDGEFRLHRRYAALPVLAGELTRAGFALARTHTDVSCIQLDGSGSGGGG